MEKAANVQDVLRTTTNLHLDSRAMRLENPVARAARVASTVGITWRSPQVLPLSSSSSRWQQQMYRPPLDEQSPTTTLIRTTPGSCLLQHRCLRMLVARLVWCSSSHWNAAMVGVSAPRENASATRIAAAVARAANVATMKMLSWQTETTTSNKQRQRRAAAAAPVLHLVCNQPIYSLELVPRYLQILIRL